MGVFFVGAMPWAMADMGESWERDPLQRGEVEFAIDLDTGLTARAGGIELEMSEPFDRQLLRREEYLLGEFRPTASSLRWSHQPRQGISGAGRWAPIRVLQLCSYGRSTDQAAPTAGADL